MSGEAGRESLTRRQALRWIGAAGAVSFVAVARPRGASAASCSVTPAETEGPYWVDELLERSDIRTDPSNGSVRPGIPLQVNLNVLRADDGCTPASGVQVDIWHCDAGGLYSDEAANGTVGRKFLRGYQTTDTSGAVHFTTIYPGWYSGRTIHIHFRIRTFSGSTTTTNFTSQLFFDEAVNDQVLAQAPYNTRGARDTTNASDMIYNASTLLALSADGSGGYVGTFDVALDGLPTGGGSTTCTDLTTCRGAVIDALPDPATAANGKSRRVARHLARLDARAETALDRAAASSGARQSHQYGKASAFLMKLLAAATAANAKGTLGASLATIEQAVGALRGYVP